MSFVGRHLILNISNIENVKILENVDDIYLLVIDIVQKLNLNFIKIVKHQFEPYGSTVVAVLKESHLALHSYFKERALSLDCYTCNSNTDFDLLCHIVYLFFEKKCKIEKIILNR